MRRSKLVRIKLPGLNAYVQRYDTPISGYVGYHTHRGGYFVDATNGSDGNSGRTPGKAWQTISKVNGATFKPGDHILFKRGETWRETLTVPASKLTFGAYGGGAKPAISGADVITGWSLVGGTTYSKAMATEPRIVHYNGTRLANNVQLPGAQNVDLCNETFEGAGYSTSGWSENSTPNEDAATTLVGSPSGWGSQCLQIVSPDNTDINSKKTLAANAAISYTRFEFILTANTISEYLDINSLAHAWTAAYGLVWQIWIQRAVLGELRFLLSANYDGSAHYFTSTCPAYMNRKYRVEVKWGYTNLSWGWRINGVDQPNNADSTVPISSDGTMSGSPATHLKMLTIGPMAGGANYKSCTLYYDNVGISATAWVGQPLGALDTNEWHWEANVLYVNVGEDPSTHALEAGQRDYPVSISNAPASAKTDVIFTGLNLTIANNSSFNIRNASGLVIDGCDLTGAGYYGTDTNGHTAGDLTDPFTIRNCAIHGMGSSGIDIAADADYMSHILIARNTVYDCCWKFINQAAYLIGGSVGIKTWGGKNILAAGESDYVTIEYNEVYNITDQWGAMSGSGIWVDQWGTNAIVRYNKVHNCDNAGIIFENMDGGLGYYNLVYANLHGIVVYRNATNQKIYNNVVSGNERSGLRCAGGSGETTMTGNLFKNNISIGNGHNLGAIYGGENAGGGSGNVYTYNCLDAAAANFVEWGQGAYVSTYAAWETAYGATTNSVQADPTVGSRVAPNFHLLAGSPCIGAGVGVGLVSDYDGVAVPALPAIGAYERNT